MLPSCGDEETSEEPSMYFFLLIVSWKVFVCQFPPFTFFCLAFKLFRAVVVWF
uniref:Uncharacterized protein n=1 Tax=Arundo donax TaxID=35708 RepID=A0A0A9B3F7_ARUDO